MTRRTVPDALPPESESSLLAKVTETARFLGWRVYHTWRSDHSDAGFPDLILVRGKRLIAAELKRDGREATGPQQDWLMALMGAGVETYLWRPRDWPEIERVLKEAGGE